MGNCKQGMPTIMLRDTLGTEWLRPGCHRMPGTGSHSLMPGSSGKDSGILRDRGMSPGLTENQRARAPEAPALAPAFPSLHQGGQEICDVSLSDEISIHCHGR